MIQAILAILGSSAVGSILGGVFAFLNKKADLDVRKLELAHEVQKWTHDLAVRDKDLELAKQEAQGRKDVAIIEGESAMETARFVTIGVAQAADNITADELRAAGKYKWMLVIGSAMKAIIRPISTVILVGAAVYLNYILLGKFVESWSNFTKDQQYEAAMQAFVWITGQASAVLGYWYVSRGSSK